MTSSDHPEPVELTSRPLEEAMLLVGRLQEAGIPARVDSDASSIYAVNDFKKVLVPRDRLADAKAVLAEIESGFDRI
jgi:translation initiation factor 2B subunit (eIF-2B alpha/beta/delta family)